MQAEPHALTIEDLKRQVVLNPKDADSYYQLAKLYLDNEDIENAVIHFQKTIRLNPSHVMAHFDLGTVYSRQEKNDDAIKEWQEVAAHSPNFMQAYYNLGLAYGKAGLQGKATIFLEMALKIVQNQGDSRGERRIQQELERLQGVDEFLILLGL